MWTAVVASRSPIVSLVVDLASYGLPKIQGIGAVIQRKDAVAGPCPEIVSEPGTRFVGRDWPVFFTMASLFNVEKLQIRRTGLRCTGLCICHKDGLIETLGQWNPSESDLISIIYDGSEPLDALTFRYDKETVESGWSHISDILVGERLDLEPTFIWRATDKQVLKITRPI
jgi:hypothetical protein